MSLTEPQDQPTQYTKADYLAFGCITGIISLVVALLLTAFFVTSDLYRAALFRTALTPLIHEAPLPTTERDQIEADLDQVLAAYDDGEVTLKQLQGLAEHLSQSPVLFSGAVAGAYDLYIKPSTMGDEERRHAQRTLYRFAEAGINGRLDVGMIQRVGRLMQSQSPKGGWLWKKDITLEELRLLVREAEAALADAQRGPRLTEGNGVDTSEADETSIGEVDLGAGETSGPKADGAADTVSDNDAAETAFDTLSAEKTVSDTASRFDPSGAAADLEDPEFPDVSRALAGEVNVFLGEEIITPTE